MRERGEWYREESNFNLRCFFEVTALGNGACLLTDISWNQNCPLEGQDVGTPTH